MVDFSLLHLGMWLGMGPLVARLFSVGLAMVTTWQINRRFTFHQESPSSLQEAMRYFSINGIGFLVNYVSYSICIIWLALSPSIAIVIGSALALSFNYIGNKKLVFSSKDSV